jgi:mannose-6-phosphate isomerase-like protein (cupin superfamily)
MQLNEGRAYASPGQLVVIPKAVCHAYHNEGPGDSVILATFSPINSKDVCPTVTGPDDETLPKPPMAKDPVG